MEDSFRVRVEKAFGSLPAAVSSSSSTDAFGNSIWSLTDEEIERREWNRNKELSEEDDEPKPYPSNLDGFFAKQPDGSDFDEDVKSADLFQELIEDVAEEYDDEDSERGRKFVKPDDYDEDAWDIRSSIGLDPTLDDEEEEDAYDKVATGMEEADGKLYLKDITAYEAHINCYNELPSTFKEVNKDPRANHIAAKIRLEEDAEAARNLSNLRKDAVTPAVDTRNNILGDGVGLKPNLKRENKIDSKPKKRVRFHSDCKEGSEGTRNLDTEPSSREKAPASGAASSVAQYASVPDYIQNPSKYVHYTFDSSSDMDEESNQRAYMDRLSFLKGPGSKESQDSITTGLPKSVCFTPKEKRAKNTSENNRIELKQNHEETYMHQKGLLTGIAAGDALDGGICAMEEDNVLVLASNESSSSQRPGRQYRRKVSLDSDDIVA